MWVQPGSNKNKKLVRQLKREATRGITTTTPPLQKKLEASHFPFAYGIITEDNISPRRPTRHFEMRRPMYLPFSKVTNCLRSIRSSA